MLGFNVIAMRELEEIAVVLVIMLVAGKDERATAAIHEVQDAEMVPAIVAATTHLRKRFASASAQTAACVLLRLLEE